MAKLYFRYGAMGSSKTANAIMVQYNYRERGQNALLLKPRLDNRDGEKLVGSRSGLSASCEFVENLDKIDLSLYDCLIVDEAQFLTKEQVQALVDVVDSRNIPVICYGLRADFRGELFEGSYWLLAWADTIEEIKTVCWCGRKATYNARIVNGRVTKSGEQIVLGGNESYVALCRKHWSTGELAPMEVRRIAAGKEEYMPLFLLAEPDESKVRAMLGACELYILSVNGRAVAQVLVEKTGESAAIKSLSVLESDRKNGYGAKLLKHILRVLSADCALVSVKALPGAEGFFAENGFEKTAEDDVYMQRSLRA